MTSPRDLEIARLLGWYRIPLRRAPKVINVDFVAFYQTGTFGSEKRWQINHYAQVRGHELTTRGELFRSEPSHPRAGEEYYKLALGPLQTLPNPISAGSWKRLTFLYTTGELLQRAAALGDLVVRSEDRRCLWRERALHDGDYQPEDLPEIPLDPLLLSMLGNLKF
jgi:hypothetical protein